MQLQLSSWPEVEAYLARSKAILIPIGSTEQHGPNGLLGTDALCPEIISRRAGDEAGILVGPTFNVGQAQHHMGFAGTITLRPSTMIAAMLDWAQSQGLTWDKQDTPDGERWGCRLEIYPVNPAEQPDPAKWETELVFRLAG